MKAEEFDEKFEAGEDLTELMDFSTARRPNQKKASNRTQITPLDDPSIRSRSSKTGYFSPSLFRKLFARKPYTRSTLNEAEF